jgi:hypothetical protein
MGGSKPSPTTVSSVALAVKPSSSVTVTETAKSPARAKVCWTDGVAWVTDAEPSAKSNV